MAEQLTEDEIDQLNLPSAFKICKQLGLDLSSKPKLQQMRWLIKYDVLCKERSRKEAIEALDVDANIHLERQKALTGLFDVSTQQMEDIGGMIDPIAAELKKMFPEGKNLMEKEKFDMIQPKAPVLVLGETGSGKSSFINLLLGQDILPCSLLSNTHVICEISYLRDDQCFAVLHPVETSGSTQREVKKIVNDNNDEKFKQELAECVQETTQEGKAVYQKAEIYLPCDILKSGLMIVDSPGIGENRHMEEVVLDYILNACTFIYIIDSTSAGGMQERMQTLVGKVYQKALDEKREYRADSAMFVCNKWDEVPFGERKEVWTDTVRKIQRHWPQCMESQIYPFSTHEAAYIQTRGVQHDQGGLSPKFNSILERINTLVPLGREILILRGYKFVEFFLDKCSLIFGAHLGRIELSKEDRMQKETETKDRLKSLQSKINTFFDGEIDFLNGKISKLATDLKQFLTKPENVAEVYKYSKNDLPTGKVVWKEVAVSIRAHVYEKMMKLIRRWEEDENQFKRIAKEIGERLEEGFPELYREIFTIEKEMSNTHTSKSYDKSLVEEQEEDLVPTFFKNKFEGLNFGLKIVMGIGLAPVFVVGMAIRLPVYGFKSLGRFISNKFLENDFLKAENKTEDLKIVCEKYAKSTVDHITEKLQLESIIKEDIQPLYAYIKQQQKRMADQINIDLDFLKTLERESRDDENIRSTYEPLRDKNRLLQQRLRHYLFVNFPRKLISDLKVIPYSTLKISNKVVCDGYEAEICLAELQGHINGVSVRKTHGGIEPSLIQDYIKIQEAFSTIKHDHIVKCLGVVCNKGVVYQVLESLQGSLRSYLPCLPDQPSRRSEIFCIVKGVVSALKFLHDKKLVAFDLSLDTVAIAKDGKAKLTNIQWNKSFYMVHKDIQQPSSYIHIHPKLFTSMKPIRYSDADDMYSLGILMWQLWVGEPAISDPQVCMVPMPGQDMTNEGPKLMKFQPISDPYFDEDESSSHSVTPSMWWNHMEDCLNRQINAKTLLTKLEQVSFRSEV